MLGGDLWSQLRRDQLDEARVIAQRFEAHSAAGGGRAGGALPVSREVLMRALVGPEDRVRQMRLAAMASAKANPDATLVPAALPLPLPFADVREDPIPKEAPAAGGKKKKAGGKKKKAGGKKKKTGGKKKKKKK